MDVLPGCESLRQSRHIGHMGQQPQLDLAVIALTSTWPGCGGEGAADAPPSSVLMGMFWRFGSLDDSRPVVVAAMVKVVWTRPVRGSISLTRLSA